MAKKQNREHLPLKTKQRCFVFVFFRFVFSSKMKKAKNARSFFSFCQDNNVVVQDNETFFCFTIVQNQQAFGNCLWLEKKKQLFFLAWEVGKLQKKCEHLRFVTKSNGQFHFFVTPIHQVMIVIANFNVFEHPPTQV